MSYIDKKSVVQQAERQRKLADALGLTWDEYLDLNPCLKALHGGKYDLVGMVANESCYFFYTPQMQCEDLMDVDILLIGNGLTGEVKSCDYPRGKFRVTEVAVHSANAPSQVTPSKIFDVILHRYNGNTYAVGIGQSTDSGQIEALIDSRKPKPIPADLLQKN